MIHNLTDKDIEYAYKRFAVECGKDNLSRLDKQIALLNHVIETQGKPMREYLRDTALAKQNLLDWLKERLT